MIFYYVLSLLFVGFIFIRKVFFFSFCWDKWLFLLVLSSVNVYKIFLIKIGKVNLNVKFFNFVRVFYYGYILNIWLLLNEN